MTPTETSATTTTLPPGRDLDVAVARAMGYEWDESRCRICGWPLVVNVRDGCVEGNCSLRPVPKKRADDIPPFSTDDATALRWGVPWLRVRGFTVRITIGPYGVWVCLFERFASGPVEGVQGKAETLAAALAQVIVAVSMVK